MSPRNEEQNQQIRDERREEILQAALRVFARKGLVAAKITDIANAAGLSHGLIYHYFNSKDEVFTELVKRALGGSTGVLEYVSELNCSPWEKLRTMTEMIFSGSYEGDSIYYYHIIIQAFTSEAIPVAVKELVNQNVSANVDQIIPILEEGQKLGQVAPDDPRKLSNAYYSLIQGMAVMQMQYMKIGIPFSPPDVDIVLRVLKNPAGQSEPDLVSTPPVIIRRFGPIRLINKCLVYRSREKAKTDFIITHETVIEAIKDDLKVYRIEAKNETGKNTLALVQADNWRPIYIEISDRQKNETTKIEYKDDSVTFDIPFRKIRKTVKLRNEFYDYNTLSQLLRAFPFGSEEKIKFMLVMDGSEGMPMGPFGMEFQKAGREKVSIPAGEFDCYKLEMGLGGMGKVFAGMYRFYFWYTVDEPRFLVKYEDTMGHLAELIKLEEM